LERFNFDARNRSDLERFKGFFDRFKLTLRFALDTTHMSLTAK